jgi:hypothetical protein
VVIVVIDDAAAKTLCISIVRGFGRLVYVQPSTHSEKHPAK